MKIKNIFFLIVGIGLIFLSVYIFTRPALSDVWNFSQTGQIGDTIGGITAPIINIIGAYLVYISFRAQNNANKLQSDALLDEKKQRIRESSFERQYNQLLSIKASLTELEFVVKVDGTNNHDGSRTQPVYHVFKGVNAIQETILRIEELKKSSFPEKYILERYNTYGTILGFQFILSSIIEFTEQVITNIDEIDDRKYLITNIKTFYNIYIKPFIERLLKVYSPRQDEIEQLRIMKERIDKIFNEN
ncbi:hypothetical protein OX284_000800 [Flavobacterium sp. SUN046]|uniref:hypothetical protein n=1 Tax=Flavobacterium sp. SUN046 TaxID=3002440 RepID=UPI002DBBF3E4|nr:hypothetical protein [Flavobacterium sp. SUN046]MEC4047951.1 hypothetical protein [Flavobacterium sp. SUN046]